MSQCSISGKHQTILSSTAALSAGLPFRADDDKTAVLHQSHFHLYFREIWKSVLMFTAEHCDVQLLMRSMNHSSSSAGKFYPCYSAVLHFQLIFPLSVLLLALNATDYKLAADNKTMRYTKVNNDTERRGFWYMWLCSLLTWLVEPNPIREFGSWSETQGEGTEW